MMIDVRRLAMGVFLIIILVSTDIISQGAPKAFLCEVKHVKAEKSELEKMGVNLEPPEVGLIPLKRECNWDEILKKLREAGKAEFLSNPHFSLLDGMEQEVILGEPVRYLEKVEEGLYRLKTLEGRINGTQIKATAKELSNGKISLSIDFNMSDVMKYQSLPGAEEFKAGMPLLSTTQTSTGLILEEGQTVRLGGITYENTAEIYLVTIRKAPPGE